MFAPSEHDYIATLFDKETLWDYTPTKQASETRMTIGSFRLFTRHNTTYENRV